MKSHHYNQINKLNNYTNYSEIDEIKSQLNRAEIKKNKLKKSIYKEYKCYLEILRHTLLTSIEKSIYEFYNYSAFQQIELNKKELIKIVESKINYLIKLNLPLITIEQLEINDNSNSINQEEIYKDVMEEIELKNEQEKLEFDDYIFYEESDRNNNKKNMTNAYKFYQSINDDNLLSIDLDHLNNFNKSNKFQATKLDSDSEIINSFKELLEEPIDGQFKKSIDMNKCSTIKDTLYQNLNCFEKIEDNLNNLLLNLSYKINSELFQAKLIKKLVSENTFKFLAKKNLLINHPFPFFIEIDLNLNKFLDSGTKLASIFLIKISSVELEFQNLRLSIQRNRINEIKNKFQILIKKERYWRQKEILLNKVKRK